MLEFGNAQRVSVIISLPTAVASRSGNVERDSARQRNAVIRQQYMRRAASALCYDVSVVTSVPQHAQKSNLRRAVIDARQSGECCRLK